jgi:oligopeptide transport system substrate-binding protein
LVFGDGVPVTAAHFRYVMERVCSPDLDSESASYYFDVVGCEAMFAAENAAASEAAKASLGVRALDDRTLEYTFDQPAPYFPVVASNWGTIPLRQELVEAGGAAWWNTPETRIGNGPFNLVEYDADGDDRRWPMLAMTATGTARPSLTVWSSCFWTITTQRRSTPIAKASSR